MDLSFAQLNQCKNLDHQKNSDFTVHDCIHTHVNN